MKYYKVDPSIKGARFGDIPPRAQVILERARAILDPILIRCETTEGVKWIMLPDSREALEIDCAFWLPGWDIVD